MSDTTTLPMTTPSTDSATAILDRPETSHGSGDHDTFAHYVDEGSQGPVEMAYIARTPVIALCGKAWVPSKSTAGRQVCPACIDQAISLGLFPKDQ